MKIALFLILLAAAVAGIGMFYVAQTTEAPEQLTAEQVVDLEVEAERQFLEAGGEY